MLGIARLTCDERAPGQPVPFCLAEVGRGKQRHRNVKHHSQVVLVFSKREREVRGEICTVFFLEDSKCGELKEYRLEPCSRK